MTPPPSTPEPKGAAPSRSPFAGWRQYKHPAVLNYLFVALGALILIFMIVFLRGSALGGLLLAIVGAAATLANRNGLIPAFLLVLTYFLVFPFGFPPADANPFEIDGSFRLADMLLTGSVLVYLIAHYRLHGLTARAMPFETVGRKTAAAAIRRPPELVRSDELIDLMTLATVVLVAGQLLFWAVVNVEPAPGADFPFQRVQRVYGRQFHESGMWPWAARFAVLGGGLLVVAVVGRVVFGYWRLKGMGPLEGAMMLQETGWNESRRETVRLQLWRIWALARRRRR